MQYSKLLSDYSDFGLHNFIYFIGILSLQIINRYMTATRILPTIRVTVTVIRAYLKNRL